jgi:dipeptidase
MEDMQNMNGVIWMGNNDDDMQLDKWKKYVMAMSHEDGATTRLGHKEFKCPKSHLMRTPLYLMCDSINLELLPNTQHIKCIHHQIVGPHKEKCIVYL